MPERYSKYKLATIDEFFAMGRGRQEAAKDGAAAVDVPSLVRLSLGWIAFDSVSDDRVADVTDRRKW